LKTLILTFLAILSFSYAQEEVEFKNEEKEVPLILKYYKEKYEVTLDAKDKFDYVTLVKDSLKVAIEKYGCMITKDKDKKDDNTGLSIWYINSDFCVFVEGSDNCYRELYKYSKQVPVIRGGQWVNGRVQYKCNVKELEGSVVVTIKAEISGKEDHMTNDIHFWESNGFFETRLINDLKKLLGLPFEDVPLPIKVDN
jgi:hypothetical protein